MADIDLPRGDAGKPTIRDLVREYGSADITTEQLLDIVFQHHPDTDETIAALQAELRRQAEASEAEANALENYGRRRPIRRR